MFCDNSDDIEIDINRHGLKIYNSGTYEIALSGVTKQVRHVFFVSPGVFNVSTVFSQVAGEIGKINIVRTRGGESSVVSTVFSHVKDAWHDDGVQFSQLALPVNSLVGTSHSSRM